MKTKLFTIIALSLILMQSCKKEEPLPVEGMYIPTPYVIDIPLYFPTNLHIPADNPMTVEGIELGRYLFYDGRLSGRTHPDSLMSCATCHIQSKGFKNGAPRAYGVTGIPTPHCVMPLINLVWNPGTFLWNGKVSRLEDLTWMGIHAPHEMNSDTNTVKALLQTISIYPPMFKKAFGSETITALNMGKAIAQFVRTLISADSKFDRYLRGEEQLTSQELQGFILFTTESGADCFHCHGGDQNPLFTTHLFYNNAKDNVFDDTRDRYAITGDPADIGAYKAPTLRNIEHTAFYMHDGRFATLEEVVDFYSEGLVYSPYAHPLMHKLPDEGAQLTPPQKQALIAFLKTLTDHTFLNNPKFAKPADLD